MFPTKNIAFYILNEKPYLQAKDFKPIFDELLKNNRPQHILLTMHFVGRLDAQGAGLYEGFYSTIRALRSAGKLITLVGDIPQFVQDPSLCIYANTAKSSAPCFLSLQDLEGQRIIYESILKRLSEEFGLTYLRIDDPLCGGGVCGMSKGNQILYRDNNHLNIIGSRLVGKYLAARLPKNQQTNFLN
jgi:hypothetical protein